MKKIYILFVIVNAFTIQTIIANSNSNPVVQDQLENLNKFWIGKNLGYPVLRESIPLSDDVSLIQMHLSLVEKTLRESKTDNLSAGQKLNRNKCLDILHTYWKNGVFPKNIYHKERTPYFIDHLGTNCAAGQLIVSTGYEEIAKKISRENNYAYVMELNKKYPELKQWADKFGFTIDELAWIQPGYVLCDTACVQSAGISVSSGTPPYTYLWTPTGQTTMYATGLCPGSTYTCIVKDANGVTVPANDCSIGFQAMIVLGNVLGIPSAYPIIADLSSTEDDGSCNGTASVYVSSGSPIMNYQWSPGGQYTPTATGLCHGIYSLTISDLNNCIWTDSISVNLATTGIDEGNGTNFSIYPNPAQDKISIQSVNAISGGATFSIYNSLGERVRTEKINSTSSMIDLTSFEDGIYFISIDSWSGTSKHMFLKNSR